MIPPRFVLALATVLLVAGCGGGTSTAPTTGPAASDVPEASAPTGASAAAPATAAPATAAPGSSGTMTVTLGGASKTYTVTLCTTMSGSLYVQAGDPTTDGAGLQVNLDTSGKPVAGDNAKISGTFAGQAWYGPPSATWDGKQGSFSGTDTASNQTVSGTFTCP